MESLYHDESLFLFLPHLCLPVIGCWHFDKRQRPWSAGLPGGVWVRAGCFYICHRAPGLRPSSDPDLSPAPSRELPINPSRHGWERVQASVLDAFPPHLPPHNTNAVQASEPYPSKCNFPFHLFKMHPKAQRCTAVGTSGWGSDTISSPRHMFTVHAFVCTDHQAVSVAIKVNGTSVVSGSFIIYDCERTGAIHPKTSWVLAAPSYWIASKFSSRENHNKCAWQPLISHKKKKKAKLNLIFRGLWYFLFSEVSN